MRYGEVVEVHFVDLADPESQAQFPEWLTVVEEQDLPYPLVTINGRLMAAGSAHYYHILPLVEEVLNAAGADQEA